MDEPRENPGWQVTYRAFTIAGETGELCRPVHFLAALEEIESPVSTALASPLGHPLIPRPAHPARTRGGTASFLTMQTQEAAKQFASERGETVNPEHLLLAVIDQGDREALEALDQAGLDLVTVRRTALVALGAPRDLPPITMPPLTPSGTLDRPPVPVENLNPQAWSALCWRQAHLPLDKIKRQGHYDALNDLEGRSAWRISSKLGLDDDQRYSLSRHHSERVEQRAAKATPDFVALRSAQPSGPAMLSFTTSQRRFSRLPHWLSFTVGWGTWFGNRRVGLRNRWFYLRTLGYFRHAPQL
jgi:Clp amino terminal domain, pathogenicity island component